MLGRLTTVLVLSMILMIAFAQQWEPSPELLEAARAEGRLSFYASTPITPTQEFIEHFESKFPFIEVELFRQATFTLWERFNSEQRVGIHNADVILSSDPPLFHEAVERGFLAEFRPHSAELFPANWATDGYAYPVGLSPLSIYYNPDLVSDEEVDLLNEGGFSAILDPRWQGRNASTTIMSGATQYMWYYTLLELLSDDYGAEYLAGLVANNPDLYDSRQPMVARLVAGDYAIAESGTDTAGGSLYSQGAPIRWVYPTPTPASVVSIALANGAANPNAAQLFIEYALSLQGQTELGSRIGVLPSLPGAVDARDFVSADWYEAPEQLLVIEDWSRYDELRESLFETYEDAFGL